MINWNVYEHTPVIELIELIKMRSNTAHLDKAHAAFHVFCFRYQKDIIKQAEYICRNNGCDKEFAIEIVEKTFQKFWKYPSFKLDKMKASTPDKGVIIYLSRIAQHSFYDLINEKNGINVSPYNGEEEIIYEIPLPVNIVNVNNENYLILKKVLDTLSWKHKVVYLTYLKYEVNNHKLPRKLLLELREKLNITQDTMRSYRHEVINKIKEYKELWNQKEKALSKMK